MSRSPTRAHQESTLVIPRLPARDDLPPTGGPRNIDIDAVWSNAIAMAARNGVEDLHVQGAFTDSQAPILNRAIHDHVYRALVAWRRCRPDRQNDHLTAYLRELAAGYGAFPQAAICGAIAEAVREFAAIEAIAEQTARQLQHAAVPAAMAYAVEPLLRWGDRDQRQIAYLLGSVPRYWEPPQLSASFLAILHGKSEGEA